MWQDLTVRGRIFDLRVNLCGHNVSRTDAAAVIVVKAAAMDDEVGSIKRLHLLPEFLSAFPSLRLQLYLLFVPLLPGIRVYVAKLKNLPGACCILCSLFVRSVSLC